MINVTGEMEATSLADATTPAWLDGNELICGFRQRCRNGSHQENGKNKFRSGLAPPLQTSSRGSLPKVHVKYSPQICETIHRHVSLPHCIIEVNLVFFSYYTLSCFTNSKSYIYSFRKLSVLSPFYSSNIFNAGCIEWLHNKSDDFTYHWYSHYSCKWGHRLGFQTETKPVVTWAKSGIHTFP